MTRPSNELRSDRIVDDFSECNDSKRLWYLRVDFSSLVVSLYSNEPIFVCFIPRFLSLGVTDHVPSLFTTYLLTHQNLFIYRIHYFLKRCGNLPSHKACLSIVCSAFFRALIIVPAARIVAVHSPLFHQAANHCRRADAFHINLLLSPERFP